MRAEKENCGVNITTNGKSKPQGSILRFYFILFFNNDK